MKAFLIILCVFVLMEPVTALIHRVIMHETLWVWHKSHHDRYGNRIEYNDYFPIVFSFIAIALFVVGINHPLVRYIAIGITLYGAIYGIVHEVVIHSRLGKIRSKNALFEYWRFSHNVHHQFHKEPYGFIVPITPKDLKAQAQMHPRDLINRFGKHQNTKS